MHNIFIKNRTQLKHDIELIWFQLIYSCVNIQFGVNFYMTKIDKFDLYLTQTILKTSNQKSNNRELSVGSLAKNISYIQNNPLNVNINSSGENFNCRMSVNSDSTSSLPRL